MKNEFVPCDVVESNGKVILSNVLSPNKSIQEAEGRLTSFFNNSKALNNKDTSGYILLSVYSRDIIEPGN